MIQRFQLRLLAGAALAAAVTAGCSSTPRGDSNTYTGNSAGEIVATETNSGLARQLAIVNPIHKDQKGFMMIQFDLENRSSRQIDIAWAIDWFDQAGFHIDANQRHFKPVSIGGNGSTTLTAVAPHSDATSWKLLVTERDEVK